MMKTTILILALSALSIQAEMFTYVYRGETGEKSTNIVADVPAGSVLRFHGTSAVQMNFDVLFPGVGRVAGASHLIPIVGPCTVIARTTLDDNPPRYPPQGYMTYDISEQLYPPEATVIKPKEQSIDIALECSEDLVNWIDAEPGLYTNKTVNLFFRIKATRE